MQTVSTPGAGKTALLYGALFGVAAGVIQIMCIFFLATAGFLLSLVLCIVALLFAGLCASRRTGKVSTGTLAGLWSGLISSVIVVSILGLLLLVMTHSSAFMNEFMGALRSSDMPSSITSQQAVVYMGLGMVILAVIWLCVGIGAGAGIGAIGGLIGKTMTPVVQYAPQPFTPYQTAPNFPPYSAPTAPTPPGPLPYPINGARMPVPSQQSQSDLPYPPPPSFYQESTEVVNPYADAQHPPYLSSDQQP